MTDKQTETYRTALKAARTTFDTYTKRLKDIENEQIILNYEVGKLRRTITALAAMCGEPGLDPLGITDAVTEVMDASKLQMTTDDVVKALVEIGFDIASQKHAGASVHSVLTRLARKEKITKIDPMNDGEVVVWRGPNYDPDYYEIPF